MGVSTEAGDGALLDGDLAMAILDGLAEAREHRLEALAVHRGRIHHGEGLRQARVEPVLHDVEVGEEAPQGAVHDDEVGAG